MPGSARVFFFVHSTFVFKLCCLCLCLAQPANPAVVACGLDWRRGKFSGRGAEKMAPTLASETAEVHMQRQSERKNSELMHDGLDYLHRAGRAKSCLHTWAGGEELVSQASNSIASRLLPSLSNERMLLFSFSLLETGRQDDNDRLEVFHGVP